MKNLQQLSPADLVLIDGEANSYNYLLDDTIIIYCDLNPRDKYGNVLPIGG